MDISTCTTLTSCNTIGIDISTLEVIDFKIVATSWVPEVVETAETRINIECGPDSTNITIQPLIASMELTVTQDKSKVGAMMPLVPAFSWTSNNALCPIETYTLNQLEL